MMVIKVQDNFDEVLRRMNGFEKQLPFAMVVALNRTANDVKAAEVAEIRRVFDRPTPYTLRSLYTSRATKEKLQAEVWLKDDRAGSGTPATRYLLPQIEGGLRGNKGFERLLQRAGIMEPGERAVPADGARLDPYGNMSRGQIVQIISQLKAQGTAGYSLNASNAKRSVAKRASQQYFASQGTTSYRRGEARQHLPRGVWLRKKTAGGSTLMPVLLFTRRDRYAKRFDFFGVGQRTVAARFPFHFDAAATLAINTAWKKP